MKILFTNWILGAIILVITGSTFWAIISGIIISLFTPYIFDTIKEHKVVKR